MGPTWAFAKRAHRRGASAQAWHTPAAAMPDRSKVAGTCDITAGRSEEEEAKQPQEGCNLVNFVRQQRFQWVGHTLRRYESFPARRMLMKQQKPYEKGSVLMDAPRHDNMDELAELAQDRKSWRATKLAIGSSKQCATPPSHQRGMRTRGAARRQLEFTVD